MQNYRSKTSLGLFLCMLALNCCASSLCGKALGSDNQTLPVSSETTVDRTYSRARECYRKNDLKGAIAALNVSLNDNPKLADAFALRAACYERLHDYRRAAADYSSYLLLEPTGEWAEWGRARSYYELGQYEKALDDWSRYTEIEYLSRECFELRADSNALLGHYDKAILDMNDALTMPRNIGALSKSNTRVIFCLTLDAVKNWDAKIRKSPHRAELYCGRAICRGLIQQYKEAEADATAALAINSKLVEPYQIRALCYAQQNDLQRSLAEFDKAIKIAPDSATTYILLAQSYINCRRAEQGFEDLKKRLLQDGKNTNLLLAHAELANYLRNNDVAVADVSKAISIDPTIMRAFYARANYYQELGKPAQAAEDYTQCIKLDPTAFKSYRQRAACYVEMKEFQKAAQDLTKMIGMHEHCEWHRARSHCYEKLGKKDLAAKDRQRVACLDAVRNPLATIFGDTKRTARGAL
jgi:tetratricopeptide (TPR) repeat protein